MENWYTWAPNNILGDLDLTKAAFVYINFNKGTSVWVVECKFFDSYVKMDKSLISNLVKKIDDGAFIKMN